MAKLSSPALLFALTLALALLPVRTVNGDDVSNSDMWLNMFNQASSSGAVSESTIDEAKKVLGEHQEQEHEQAASSSYTDSSMILESARNSLAQAAAKKAAADALNNGFGFAVVPTPPSLPDFSDWVEKAR
ncbi:hypothetical protein PIB30_051324 [Stylosanthes scabra]|uniref:Uncharacterized protein n=1 Tax=Stylosanthes scabra TaxID=79078 RepID=A0ABU6THM8_9FABA|nr:hypothetical protein [Stylosanthes scabra]